jgi:hypothetical protein
MLPKRNRRSRSGALHFPHADHRPSGSEVTASPPTIVDPRDAPGGLCSTVRYRQTGVP